MRKEKVRQGEGVAMGDWATFSCDSLVPAEQDLRYIPFFHLTVACGRTHLTLQLSWSDNIRFMTDSAGCIITLWPMVKCSVPIVSKMLFLKRRVVFCRG